MWFRGEELEQILVNGLRLIIVDFNNNAPRAKMNLG